VIGRAALLALILVTLPATGCAYARNRGRDFADIFTVAGTVGLGANAQVMPAVVGVGGTVTKVGLENGAWQWGEGGVDGGVGVIALKGSGHVGGDRDRMKEYGSLFVLGLAPVGLFEQPKLNGVFYGKIEASVALGVGVKVGFNIVEFFDFLAGIVGCDPAGDDVAVDPEPAATPAPAAAPTSAAGGIVPTPAPPAATAP
jgi:hypothetical protein